MKHMEDPRFRIVGFIKNGFDEPVDHHQIKSKTSEIVILDEFVESMFNIEKNDYLDIVFYLHRSEPTKSPGPDRLGEERGPFASRSPHRPNLIGITTVRLVERKGNTLTVKGLDALNNSPVLDIKTCDTSLFASEQDTNPVHNGILKTDPRIEVRNNIINRQLDILMIKAAQLHGHFCPGLAMGVMAASYAMNRMNAESDGMEDLLAITETNNCFSDGVQFVTGCSFGNNSLIYHDLGKTAFTLTKRDGKGVRICSLHESREVIMQKFPEFDQYYQLVVVQQDHSPENISKYKKLSLERAFGTLDIPMNKLFTMEEVRVDIPPYAGIQDSVICASCNESVMKTRTIKKEGQYFCYPCSGKNYRVLDGQGIR